MAANNSDSYLIDDDLTSTAGTTLSVLDSRLLSDEDDPPINASSSEQAEKQRKRKLKAIQTWSYSRPPKPGEPERIKRARVWYCKYEKCKEFKAVNTTNARIHLESQHGIIIKEAESVVERNTKERLKSLFEKQGLQAEAMRKKSQECVLREVINKDVVHEALAQLITVRNLPHNAVEWAELRALLLTVNWAAGDVFIDSHSTVPRLINRSFTLDKAVLKQRLRSSISKIHFTIDCWSSPNRKSFQAICAHFVDDEYKLRKALLALPYHPKRHGGQEQAYELMKVIDDYEIIDRIGYFTGDNHGSNDKMLRFVAQALRERGFQYFDAKQARIRCHGHIINIAVQAFIFSKDPEAVEAAIKRAEDAAEDDNLDIEDHITANYEKACKEVWREMGSLGKVHNLAVWLRGSNTRYNEFLELAKKMLTLDNDTRWNSWFTMLEIALELQPHINTTLAKYYDDIKLDFLLPEDWQNLRHTYEFLQPFFRVTQETQGDFSTLDRTLYTMDFLISHFRKAEVKHTANPHLFSAIRTSWYAFDKYYSMTDSVTAYAAALLLSPNRRKAYIMRNWKKSWQTEVIKNVRKLWEKQYKDKVRIRASSSELMKEPDEFDLWERDQSILTQIGDEFEAFTTGTPVLLDKTETALDWWLQPSQRRSYPNLSQMAIDILSIPAMSAEPERVFSGCRRTISWTRMRLGIKVIEEGECLKSWIRSGVVAGLRRLRDIEAQEAAIEADDDDEDLVAS